MTFLMVFLIQATQNRDSKAVHLKLDELIRCTQVRNVVADIEDATDEEVAAYQREFEALRRRFSHLVLGRADSNDGDAADGPLN